MEKIQILLLVKSFHAGTRLRVKSRMVLSLVVDQRCSFFNEGAVHRVTVVREEEAAAAVEVEVAVVVAVSLPLVMHAHLLTWNRWRRYDIPRLSLEAN